MIATCTVHRSSLDSSVLVPMKSNVRQLWASLSSWVRRPCWAESVKSSVDLFSSAVRSRVELSWNISNSYKYIV